MKILIIFLICHSAWSAVPGDKMDKIPGYPDDFPTGVYSGYLDVKNVNRSIHYVFVESTKGANNSDPVTIWLNGGPGCSSMLGFLQEIGPYYLEDGKNYSRGDNLTENPHSWHRASNLLFLQSPAGVGFSYNLDTNYQNNDINTAYDNFNALLDFLSKFSQYKSNRLWIAGESYAGKYIPDLAVLIDQYNEGEGGNSIDLRGILVGNGVMSFEGGELYKSSIDYMIQHSFVDPEMLVYWKSSCQTDPDSAGCRFFQTRYEENTLELNPYNVYSYCYYNDSFEASPAEPPRHSQQSLLYKRLKEQFGYPDLKKNFNGAPCAYFDGVLNYFSSNEEAYHAKFPNMKWNGPCAENITYTIDSKGSLASYRYLLARVVDKRYQIVLYNGDWDTVVPYLDTIKWIKALGLGEAYVFKPWFTGDQHSGFYQIHSGILFETIKGASHQVPQSKRAEAFQLFNETLAGHVGIWEDYVFRQKLQTQ